MSVPKDFTLIFLDETGLAEIKKILGITTFPFEAVTRSEFTKGFIQKNSERWLSHFLRHSGNVFHRTTPEANALIFSADPLSNGLRTIDRLVHMAMEEDRSRNADKFPIKITVDVANTRVKGITFYLSANNVVLSYDPIPLSCLST